MTETERLRAQLVSQARGYLDSCDRDLAECQKRRNVAQRILAHTSEGKEAGSCPTPFSNESSASVERFAARVDALLLALYNAENPEECHV